MPGAAEACGDALLGRFELVLPFVKVLVVAGVDELVAFHFGNLRVNIRRREPVDFFVFLGLFFVSHGFLFLI
jgi:hypothetical protein